MHAHSHPKTAGLAVPVSNVMAEKSLIYSDVGSSYLPFIREGFVPLTGSDKKVPVKILRDGCF